MAGQRIPGISSIGRLLSARATGGAAPAKAPRVEGTLDVTGELDRLYAEARQGRIVLPSDADRYVYLFVPGFLAKHYPNTLRPNREALTRRGLDARMSRIDTNASVETNAGALAKEVRQLGAQTGAKVIPVVHSSGAPELHQALIDSPDIRGAIRCAIALSGTFRGTPLAHRYDRLSGPMRQRLHSLSAKLGIDAQGLADVAVARREAFQREHPYPADVPTLSIACAFTGGVSLLQPLVAHLRGLSPEGLSDGVVPTAHQSLPGHRVAYLLDADHSDTIMARRFSKHDPGALTLAAVTLALQIPA